MKTAIRPSLQLKSVPNIKGFYPLRKEETRLINYKLYQKIFVVIISFSTILIFPESPRELESICETYNSTKLCNVW